MKIAEFSAFVVQLQLRKPFKHASYTRHTSENLLIRCRLADGTEGWGEGVPRDYVTGETPEGAMAQLAATDLAEQFNADSGSWDDVIQLCSRYQPAIGTDDPRGCLANSHRCAVELSVLDAYGRLFGEPLRRLTALFDPAAPVADEFESVRYSGGVSVATPRKEIVGALKIRLYGFHQCKLKVGLSAAEDQARLRRVRRWLGRGMDIRVDANEAWAPEQLLREVEPLIPYNVSCLEQPVAHEEVDSLAELRRQIPLPLMLDESLTSLIDAEAAIRAGTCDLFNIRLSKCGGFLNALRLAAMANQAGLGYQLGCHPGESGVLSAAGRHFASSVRDIRYLEGSYDRHLLSELLTHEDITFGYGGRAPALDRPGLGVTINPSVLERRTLRHERFRLG